MTDILEVIFVVLAVYRVALMVTTEDGPFGLFVQTRLEATNYAPNTWVERGLHCPLCVGFWVSALGAVFITSDFPSWILAWLGIAGAQTFLTMISGIPDTDEEKYEEEEEG